DVIESPTLIERQIVSLFATKRQTFLEKVSQHFFFSQKSITKIGNLTVKGIDVIEIEFTGRYGGASLEWRRPTDSTYTGNKDVEVIFPSTVGITYLKGSRARGIAGILIGTKLHPINMIVPWNYRLWLYSESRSSKEIMSDYSTTTFRAICLNSIADNLSF